MDYTFVLCIDNSYTTDHFLHFNVVHYLRLHVHSVDDGLVLDGDEVCLGDVGVKDGDHDEAVQGRGVQEVVITVTRDNLTHLEKLVINNER